MTRSLEEVCASTLNKARLFTYDEMFAEADRLALEWRVRSIVEGNARFDASWRAGYLWGTLVTTLLLGGGIAFTIWIDWLGRCA